MTQLRLTEKADLGVIYDAEKLRYPPEAFEAMGLSRDAFIKYYESSATLGYEIDGLAIGGAIFDGKELHLAVMPQYFGRWAWLLRPTLDWMFKMRDPVYVKIEVFNTRCINFMDAGRWPRVAEDTQFITYLLSTNNNDIFRRHRDRLARTQAQGIQDREFAELATE